VSKIHSCVGKSHSVCISLLCAWKLKSHSACRNHTRACCDCWPFFWLSWGCNYLHYHHFHAPPGSEPESSSHLLKPFSNLAKSRKEFENKLYLVFQCNSQFLWISNKKLLFLQPKSIKSKFQSNVYKVKTTLYHTVIVCKKNTILRSICH
jgi:hypothetical protein